MATKTIVEAEREAAAADDALAVAMAHGDAEQRTAARARWRKAQRRLNQLATSAPARRR